MSGRRLHRFRGREGGRVEKPTLPDSPAVVCISRRSERTSSRRVGSSRACLVVRPPRPGTDSRSTLPLWLGSARRGGQRARPGPGDRSQAERGPRIGVGSTAALGRCPRRRRSPRRAWPPRHSPKATGANSHCGSTPRGHATFARETPKSCLGTATSSASRSDLRRGRSVRRPWLQRSLG